MWRERPFSSSTSPPLTARHDCALSIIVRLTCGRLSFTALGSWRGKTMTEETIAPAERPKFEMVENNVLKAGTGTALIWIGLFVTMLGLFYSPTVDTAGYGLAVDEVVNFGKAVTKLMIFNAGIGLVLIGMVLRGNALILDYVHETTLRQRYQMEADQ